MRGKNTTNLWTLLRAPRTVLALHIGRRLLGTARPALTIMTFDAATEIYSHGMHGVPHAGVGRARLYSPVRCTVLHSFLLCILYSVHLRYKVEVLHSRSESPLHRNSPSVNRLMVTRHSILIQEWGRGSPGNMGLPQLSFRQPAPRKFFLELPSFTWGSPFSVKNCLRFQDTPKTPSPTE